MTALKNRSEIEPDSKARLRLWLRLLKSTRAIESELRERLRTEFASTLPRFYALHVSILPLAAALLLALLLKPVLARRPPAGSRQTGWLAFALAVLGLAYVVAALVPAPLELPADATDAEYIPRPEWYFLWLFQFGKYVESVPWVRSLLLPAVVLLDGVERAVDLAMVPEVGVGDYVIVHSGYAISALTSPEARERLALLEQGSQEAGR